MGLLQYVFFCSVKAFFLLLTKTRLSTGSTWPGHISLFFDKKFVKHVIDRSSAQAILVIGTNGKTTTSRMISHLLKKNGGRVLQNLEGANLLNGIASTLLKHSTWRRRLPYDFAVFEVDENNLSPILSQTCPSAIVCLNLFRDQLDRYGEVNTIATSWKRHIDMLPISSALILNADDPLVRYFGEGVHPNTHYFSVASQFFTQKELSHDVDSVFCPIDESALTFSKISYSHIGKYKCPVCGYTNPFAEDYSEISEKHYPMDGAFNIYNTNAAVLAVSQVLKDVSTTTLFSQLSDFQPVFGRGERLRYKGREFVILLSKNPAGLNLSLQLAIDAKKATSVLFVLNDNIPDGRDVSWIWDVDFERLSKTNKKIYLSGKRGWDLANRLHYAGVETDEGNVSTDLQNTVDTIVENTKTGELIYILPTYSAMLEVRRILVGRKLL